MGFYSGGEVTQPKYDNGGWLTSDHILDPYGDYTNYYVDYPHVDWTAGYKVGSPNLHNIDMTTPWPHKVTAAEVTPMLSPYGNWDAIQFKGGNAGDGILYVGKTPYTRGWIENGLIVVQWLCQKSCCYKFVKWAHAKELNHISFTKVDDVTTWQPEVKVKPPIDWELRRKLLAERIKNASPEIQEEVKRLLQEAADILYVDGWTKGVAHKWNSPTVKEPDNSDYPLF